jgi:hypothetical protein
MHPVQRFGRFDKLEVVSVGLCVDERSPYRFCSTNLANFGKCEIKDAGIREMDIALFRRGSKIATPSILFCFERYMETRSN